MDSVIPLLRQVRGSAAYVGLPSPDAPVDGAVWSVPSGVLSISGSSTIYHFGFRVLQVWAQSRAVALGVSRGDGRPVLTRMEQDIILLEIARRTELLSDIPADPGELSLQCDLVESCLRDLLRELESGGLLQELQLRLSASV